MTKHNVVTPNLSHSKPVKAPKFLTDFEIGVRNDYSDYSILQ